MSTLNTKKRLELLAEDLNWIDEKIYELGLSMEEGSVEDDDPMWDDYDELLHELSELAVGVQFLYATLNFY